jgi:hypothetical protein
MRYIDNALHDWSRIRQLQVPKRNTEKSIFHEVYKIPSSGKEGL